MAVTAAMVKELRETTGAGMMDCKKALAATDGDMEKAVEFLREIRMKRAAQLIETEEYSMAQIAYMVGLNDSHYFSKCFKEIYHVSPLAYRKGEESEEEGDGEETD